MKRSRDCELCGGEAAVHCLADAAYLCWPCDARVHCANFLVARHLRAAPCSSCGGGARWISGPGSPSPPARPLICHNCCADDSSTADSASSSSCLSTAESSAVPPPSKPARFSTALAEGILAGWCRGLGLSSGLRCAEIAAHALGMCGKGMMAVPLRVALAAALWHAIKACEGETTTMEKKSRTCEALLRKLEARSRVPARLIVLVERRRARAHRRRVLAAEEGWAECE